MVLTAIAMVLVASSAISAAPFPGPSSSPPALSAAKGIDTEFVINLVYVGYDESDIDLNALEGELPSSYDPIVRFPAFYGIHLPVNIHGVYEYNNVFAHTSFNNAFFDYLASIGTEGPTTQWQEFYNEQVHKSLTITDPVLYIDAPSTEYWLMTHGRSDLGLDVANYTIFFVNWYGREDFQFHVYTKTDSPDPDTGYNFGKKRSTRKMIAWGGSHGRTWFYDLSAGPEFWTDNWNVDDPDIDGGGDVDYRMPPVWEYGNLSGYRPFDDLSGDLGKVARWVAINLLFTTSPLYDPFASEPFPGRGKRMIITMFEDDPASSGMDWIKKSYILKTMGKFQKQYKWKVKIKDKQLVDPALTSFRIFAGLDPGDGCWLPYGTPFAELFCFFTENRDAYLPPIRPGRNYIGGVYAFNTTAANLGGAFGLLGFADDDWVSGTPSVTFAFDSEEYRDLGFGFSTTLTHEIGHHIGMSHPTDGYDSQSETDYGPTGEFYYAWSGDESHTVMQYLALANEFGWFDRDNMNRFLVGRYLSRSAEIATQIGQAPENAAATRLVAGGEADFAAARGAYAARDYEGAAGQARTGFGRVYRAAQAAGLNVPIVEPLPAGGMRTRPKIVDTIHRHHK